MDSVPLETLLFVYYDELQYSIPKPYDSVRIVEL